MWGLEFICVGCRSVNVGGVLSRTVIVWLTVAAESFPHASVAFQVRVRDRMPTRLHSSHQITSSSVFCFIPLHVSVAVGVPNTGVAGQSIVWAGGTTVKVGGVVSRTASLCLSVPAESFPHASFAFHVRVRV